jgi:hypothetical protein
MYLISKPGVLQRGAGVDRGRRVVKGPLGNRHRNLLHIMIFFSDIEYTLNVRHRRIFNTRHCRTNFESSRTSHDISAFPNQAFSNAVRVWTEDDDWSKGLSEIELRQLRELCTR